MKRALKAFALVASALTASVPAAQGQDWSLQQWNYVSSVAPQIDKAAHLVASSPLLQNFLTRSIVNMETDPTTDMQSLRDVKAFQSLMSDYRTGDTKPNPVDRFQESYCLLKSAGHYIKSIDNNVREIVQDQNLDLRRSADRDKLSEKTGWDFEHLQGLSDLGQQINISTTLVERRVIFQPCQRVLRYR